MNIVVYILQSVVSGRYYIGVSRNVQKRLAKHNRGKVESTRDRGPWKIVYIEEALSEAAAFTREKQIKRYKGGKAFKKLLESPYSSGIV